jgi:pimeloyl-ACP methyl ester carboxylesterase
MKAALLAVTLTFAASVSHAAPAAASDAPTVAYRTVKIENVDIFYREAGPKDAPLLILLHGFPTSSHMYRKLIPLLADRYHVIAPDYPGFGKSGMPGRQAFTYSFDHLAAVMDKFTEALGASRYALYLQDYGAPVGFRIAAAHPERVSALVVQNGNAYQEGIDHPFWDPMKAYWADRSEANAAWLRPLLEAGVTRWQYTEGARDIQGLSPDTWTLDQAYLDRPGNKEIQLELLYDYRSNPPRYAEWQSYLRKHQPPMLIVWGKNDKGFPPIAAQAYLRDVPKAELHLLDTGHFALEEDSEEIAKRMRSFLGRTLAPGAATADL